MASHRSCTTTIELEDVDAPISQGAINQAFIADQEHLQVPKPHYGLAPRNSSANNNSKATEDVIPELTESGFQPFRQHLVCPYCKRAIITDINLRNGRRVWITFLLFILSGLCLIVPLFFCYIAFLMDWLKDVYHFCPKCKNRLGKYVRR